MKTKYTIYLIILFFGVFGLAKRSEAADHYVRSDAGGASNGSNWTDAWSALPDSLIRGDTYYVADGNYNSYTFNDPVSEQSYITIKKATIADHGIETGWTNSYGDGQAIFADHISFLTGYYRFDGNGTHTVPTSNSSDYGFKISSNAGICNATPCAGTLGILRIGDGSEISNIIVKYTHVYNTYNGNDGNVGAVSVRFYPTSPPKYVKLQNCFFENSGKDGIQISAASYVLMERCYLKKLGLLYSPSGLPDVHGQTVQIFYGGDDVVFRWNIWEANQGQGLVQIAGINSTSDRIRFYGNIVFVGYGETSATAGFNSTGGIIGDAWNYNTISYIINYNNTFANIGGDYDTSANGSSRFPILYNRCAENCLGYNNLFYNCKNLDNTGWNAFGYNASGAGDQSGGANEQTGITDNILRNYSSNDFRLAFATEAGLILTSQAWWNGAADSFFGSVDSALDMQGNIRGNDGVWDRGAYEYVGGGPVDTIPPATPSGLSVK